MGTPFQGASSKRIASLGQWLTHTPQPMHFSSSTTLRSFRMEMASNWQILGAGTACLAFFCFHPAEVAGGGQHGGTVALGFHCPAAAGATVADGVEPPEHGILKECMVDVPALLFLFQDLAARVRK